MYIASSVTKNSFIPLSVAVEIKLVINLYLFLIA